MHSPVMAWLWYFGLMDKELTTGCSDTNMRWIDGFFMGDNPSSDPRIGSPGSLFGLITQIDSGPGPGSRRAYGFSARIIVSRARRLQEDHVSCKGPCT